MAEIVMIHIDHLFPHPDNPRKDLGDLTELADSIRAKGVLQNLTVIPSLTNNEHYIILIGHRRHAAAKLAGLKELPCAIVEMSYEDQLATMLVENIQRSDLTVYEESKGFQMMLNLGKSVKEVSDMSGFSESTIRKRVKLAELDEKKFKKAVDRGATLFDFAELDKIEDLEKKNELLDVIGKPDFRNELSAALTAQKNRKLIEQWVSEISEWAKRAEDVAYSAGTAKITVDGAEIIVKYIRNYGTWHKSASVNKPEDADSLQYYFVVGRRVDQIDIYKEITDAEEEKVDAAQLERQRKQEQFEEKRAQFVEMSARHRQLRLDFIESFNQYGKKQTEVWEFITEALIYARITGYYGDRDDLMTSLGEILGIEYDKATGELKYHDFLSLKQSAPERTALLTAFWIMDTGSFWTSQWSPDQQRYLIRPQKNERLDSLYSLLSYLGYSRSLEETKLRDGSHELFDSLDASEEDDEEDWDE